MSKKIKLRPIDINLPEDVLLSCGAMCVTLPTLDDLDKFWSLHRKEFLFAANCVFDIDSLEPSYLKNYQWIFGKTKSSVIAALTRWQELGVECCFYEWKKLEPNDHDSFFEDRDYYRQEQIANERWTAINESDYQADCLLRSRQTYIGYWQLSNLPFSMSDCDWLSPFAPELFDPSLSVDQATKTMQEITFDDWLATGASEPGDPEVFDRKSLGKYIEYWKGERAEGMGYYGQPEDCIDANVAA